MSMSRVHRLAMLEFEVLTIDVFFSIIWCVTVPIYSNASIFMESYRISVTSLLERRVWTLALRAKIFRLTEELGFHLVLGLVALARVNEVYFSFADETGYFSFSFTDSIVYDLRH